MLGAGALAVFVAWEWPIRCSMSACSPIAGFAAGALSVTVQLFCALGVLILSIQYLAYVLG